MNIIKSERYMSKILEKILIPIIVAALCAAGVAYTKVEVLDEKIKTDRELIQDTHKEVKEIHKLIIDHMIKGRT
jgi:hypothetical protein